MGSELGRLAFYVTLCVGLLTMIGLLAKGLRNIWLAAKAAIRGIETLQGLPKQVESIETKQDTLSTDVATVKCDVDELKQHRREDTKKLAELDKSVAILLDRDGHPPHREPHRDASP